MSKKNVLLDLGASTSKVRQQKKKLDDEILRNYEELEVVEEPSSVKKKLRKSSDINKYEEFVPDQYIVESDVSEKLDIQIEDQSSEKNLKFDCLDDEDMLREKEQKKTKSGKKSQSNPKLDNFLVSKDKIVNSKQVGQKPAKGKKLEIDQQRSLAELMNIQNIRKKNRKNSFDIVADDPSEKVDDDFILACRIAAEEQRKAQSKLAIQYNGIGMSEQQAIQKVKKLSLTTSSERSSPEQKSSSIKNLTASIFENIKNQKRITQDKTSKESISKQHTSKPKTHEEKNISKEKKDKPKSKVKNEKFVVDGPFSGMQIATTGEFEAFEKSELTAIIQSLGGHYPKSLTKKCSVLLQGSYVQDHFKRRIADHARDTTKSRQAADRKIRIVAYEDIDSFFEQKTGKTLTALIEQRNPQIINYTKEYRPLEKKGHSVEEKIQIIPPITSNEALKVKREQLKLRAARINAALWTDKYKPNSLDEVIIEPSKIRELRRWLQDWQDVHYRGNKKEVKEPKGFMATGSINSKATLISGDPGLGKTTTARLLAAELNYAIDQFNASDIRNKSGVALLQNNSFSLQKSYNCRKLIIMDQVDGMSTGDRGGIASIINMIKDSQVPIICICNDRSSQKIRSLAGHCFDIRFHQPQKKLIVQRVKTIIENQGGTASEKCLERIIEMFHGDIRQIISYVQLSFKTVSHDFTLNMHLSDSKAKDSSVMSNHFDAIRKLMNRSEFTKMSIRDRLDCFFIDSDKVPIMVHENYMNSVKKCGNLKRNDFHRLVQATEGFVIGDQLDRTIRKSQQYALMPSYGFMTCVYTTEKVSEGIGNPAFPSFLGKFSSQRKQRRLIRQLKNAISVRISGSNIAVKEHYSAALFQEIYQHLKRDDIESVVSIMQTYNLTPALLNENLIVMQFNPDKVNLMAGISSNQKSKLTRLYNKKHMELKLKAAKKEKVKVEHVKFDPVLEDMQVVSEAQGDNGEEKEEEEVESPKDSST